MEMGKAKEITFGLELSSHKRSHQTRENKGNTLFCFQSLYLSVNQKSFP